VSTFKLKHGPRIAGRFSRNEGPLSVMVDRLRERGPDAAALFLQDQIGLGHRRRSILDLAPTHTGSPALRGR
jgi:asparagine synthetase B (glutamine-hydrolysing)